MKTIQIIPSPFPGDTSFPNVSKTRTFECSPYPMPTGVTFPDGTVIDAFRVPVLLTGDGLRIYALRCGNALLVFSPEGEDATAAALTLAAQVDSGVAVTINAP